MNDLAERLTQAFSDLFALNVFPDWPDYQGGGPGYYGVQLEAFAPDSSELDLVLTFMAGNRYCCFEFVDHFAYHREESWSRLRVCMDQHGLRHLPLPTIRKTRIVIEQGAVMAPSPRTPMAVWNAATYETGPFLPIKRCE